MQSDEQLRESAQAFMRQNYLSMSAFADRCGLATSTVTSIMSGAQGFGPKSRRAFESGMANAVVVVDDVIRGDQDNVEVEGVTVRKITTADGVRWYVATDACDVLQVKDASETAERLTAAEKGTAFVGTPFGLQRMIVVNDAGLNLLMMRGNAERAQAFQRKLAHVVVPAIQKQGGYVEEGSPLATMIAALLSKIEAMEAQPKALPDPASIIASKIDKLSPTVQQIVVAAAYGIKPEARSVWTATDIASDLKDHHGLIVSPQTVGKIAKANGVQCPEVEQQNEYGYWAETWRRNEHGAAKVVPQYQYNKAGYDRLFDIFGNAGRLPFSG